MHDRIPGDHDAGHGAAQARRDDSLALGVLHPEPGEVDPGTSHDHGREDGLRAEFRQRDLECRRDARFIDGRLLTLEGQRLRDDHLFVIGPRTDDDGAPSRGGVNRGLDGLERGGTAGSITVPVLGTRRDVQNMAMVPGVGKGGSRLCHHHASDQQRREQRDRQPPNRLDLMLPPLEARRPEIGTATVLTSKLGIEPSIRTLRTAEHAPT